MPGAHSRYENTDGGRGRHAHVVHPVRPAPPRSGGKLKTFRRIAACLGLLTALAGGLIPAQASADPAAPPRLDSAQARLLADPILLRIANVPLTDGCMAVPGGSTEEGVQPIVWGCGTWADHYWLLEPATTSGWTIRNLNSGLCATMRPSAFGDIRVYQDDCVERANQRWFFDYWSDDTVMFEIRNLDWNSCIAPYDLYFGAPLMSEQCNNDWTSPTYWYLYD